jgi:ATPase subunit of ABC transporter with duplicated ATPase domains
MDGVKSRKKVIFKMSNVSFAYPASSSFSILESNFEMSQASRILVAGAKGSGKSTLVKVLSGKLKLTEGAIQKAVGISVAYVSQHVFHQLEERMHMTPLQYMMWRFASGSDRENPESQRHQKPRLPTQTGIEQHCSDFGVDQESVNRLHIKQLNKSMRFKLVLSAAMWLNPNLLVLDEPASCLDHCSLEALAAAIEDYKGGVLITSNSSDRHYFEGAATETYVLSGGRLRADARRDGDDATAPCDVGAGRGAAGPQGLTARQAKDLYQDISRCLKEGKKSTGNRGIGGRGRVS